MRRFVTVALVCCVTTLAGCGRSRGKKTFEFLKAEREIIEKVKAELPKSPQLKPPPPPEFSLNGLQRAKDEKTYRVAMGQYLSAIVLYSQQLEQVLNGAETKISRLDSSGIGDDAVSLTRDHERMLGDMVQECVEVKAMMELIQADVQENKESELIGDLVAGTVAGLGALGEGPHAALVIGAGGFFKGVASDENRDRERYQELKSHYANLQKVVAEMEHYRGEMVTKRSELVTSYRAKFPEYNWSSLLPDEEQATGQPHN